MNWPERVGQDRGGVGHQHGPAYGLDDPEADQPQGAARPGVRVERQCERAEAEDRESGVVHPDPAVDVPEPAEGDDEHGGDDEVAHQHPEQIADIAGLERVQVNAAEDGGQCDDHD